MPPTESTTLKFPASSWKYIVGTQYAELSSLTWHDEQVLFFRSVAEHVLLNPGGCHKFSANIKKIRDERERERGTHHFHREWYERAQRGRQIASADRGARWSTFLDKEDAKRRSPPGPGEKGRQKISTSRRRRYFEEKRKKFFSIARSKNITLTLRKAA